MPFILRLFLFDPPGQLFCTTKNSDQNSLAVRMADESVFIGPSPSSESYLCGDKIIDACKITGADAVHPGTIPSYIVAQSVSQTTDNLMQLPPFFFLFITRLRLLV